jgi:hypothetical protein
MPDPLFSTTWVHVAEEDTPEGAVYRPDDDEIPLSRRPRERLALDEDGAARVYAPGPDDRFIEQTARWSEEGRDIVVRMKGRAALRIVTRSPRRLVIARGTSQAV